MWVLRFGNGITSAGISVTDAFAKELRLSEGTPAWERFLTDRVDDTPQKVQGGLRRIRMPRSRVAQPEEHAAFRGRSSGH